MEILSKKRRLRFSNNISNFGLSRLKSIEMKKKQDFKVLRDQNLLLIILEV